MLFVYTQCHVSRTGISALVIMQADLHIRLNGDRKEEGQSPIELAQVLTFTPEDKTAYGISSDRQSSTRQLQMLIIIMSN